MNANNYQIRASKTARYSNAEYPFLALGEEAGEVLGKLAKAVRKQHKPIGVLLQEVRDGKQPELATALEKELGDLQWQLSEAARMAGFTLSGVMYTNLSKLGDRKERGVLVGEGDDR